MEDMRMHHIGCQLVMVDETSKDDQMIYGHYGYAPAGCHATIHANFMRGECYRDKCLAFDNIEIERVTMSSW
jgi:hypothetical protein